MARILLVDIRGWQGGVCAERLFPNVGIAYLASSLKFSGHSVVVADMNNDQLSNDDVLRILIDQMCDFVGLSVKTSTMATARKLGRFLKLHTSSPIILGGAHASIQAENLISEPWVDYVFVGEAEDTLSRFCHDPRRWDVEQLPGLRTKNGAPATPHYVAALDELPFPDYGVFSGPTSASVALNYPLVTSRGCVYNCSYCSVPHISGSRFRKRKPEIIIAELQSAVELLNIKEFSIIDDAFNLDMERAKEFCLLLINSGLGLRWSCPNGIRADRIDPELARLMKASGCHSVMVGVESADPAILGAVKKGESLDDIIRGITFLMDAGLSVGGFFVIGLPGDSFAAQERSVEFALNYGISAHFNMLVPYPGTELYKWVKDNGRILLPVEEGVHFADCSSSVRPVFDTPDFSAKERIRAYEMVHTRLDRFDMLIPASAGRIRYYVETVRLLLQYDRRQLFKRLRCKFLGQ